MTILISIYVLSAILVTYWMVKHREKTEPRPRHTTQRLGSSVNGS